MRRHFCCSGFRINRLYAKKGNRRISHGLNVRVRLNLDVRLKIAAFEEQPILVDGIDMIGASNQRYRNACTSEHPAEITSDGSSPDYGDMFLHSISETPLLFERGD